MQTQTLPAQAPAAEAAPAVEAEAAPASLFTRDDTFFGVCQGLGEDFGISPNLLRLAFALGLFFNPYGAVAAYALAGAVVLTTRLLAPAPTPRAPEQAPAPEQPADQSLPLAA